MLTNKTQKSASLETKNALEGQEQVSPRVNPKNVQTLSLIEAIKQNNQEEFFRFLKSATVERFSPIKDPLVEGNLFGKRVVDEVDAEYSGSALYWAAAYGHVHFIDPLLKAEADIRKQDKDGKTPVYVAAQNGHTKAIHVLRAAGANVDTPTWNSSTPVFIASSNGHAATISALKLSGANVDTPNDGRTPVYIAASNGHAEAIIALKAAGAAMDTPNNYGATPVFVAAQNGHAEAITVLKAAGADVDTPDKYGTTPVCIAAYKGRAAAVAALLDSGANANIKASWGTALERAKKGTGLEYAEVVRLLEAHLKQYPRGVKLVRTINNELFSSSNLPSPEQDNSVESLSQVNDSGFKMSVSLLIEAIKKNNQEEVFRILNLNLSPLEKKAIDEVDFEREGGSLYWAAFYGHIHFIVPLIQAGANVNKPDKEGKTPVYVAAENGHADAIRALKVAGANANTPDDDGFTPVYIAALNGYASAIAALKEAGAAMNTPEKRCGWTPAYIAARNGHASVIAALKEAGAAMDTPNNYGVTPIYIAAREGHAAAVTALLNVEMDATIEAQFSSALEQAKQGKSPGHTEVVRLLEAHLRQHPHGIKPVNQSSFPEKNNPPVLTQFHQPTATTQEATSSQLNYVFKNG